MDFHKSHNILVVDEEDEYVPLIENILENSFPDISNVFWFENEGAVLDFLKAKKHPTISIIILDIENSTFDGIALLKRLKAELSPLKIIPIIVFSSLEEFSVIKQCFSLGVNSWVQKPTDVHNFQTVLEIICEFWLKNAILPSSII